MQAYRLILSFFIGLLLLFTGLGLVQAENGQPASAAAVAQVPQTNGEIRQWYNDQVAVIPALDEQWLQRGVSAEERARRAHAIRHDARVKAREFMKDKSEVADLQKRDQEVYGNPDGPSFDYLVQKNRAKGLQGEAIYEAIIGSANRTNAKFNQQYNVQPRAAP